MQQLSAVPAACTVQYLRELNLNLLGRTGIVVPPKRLKVTQWLYYEVIVANGIKLSSL